MRQSKFSYSVKTQGGSLTVRWDEDQPPTPSDLRSLFAELPRAYPDVFDMSRQEQREREDAELDRKNPDLLNQKDFERWAERREKKKKSGSTITLEGLNNEGRQRRG